jgi:ankyrin repeat protein
MFRAIDLGDAKGVMTLLEEDPALLEVAMVSWHRETPLIHAAARGKLEIVKLLTGKGAHIHATTWLDGKTALHCAAERGHEKVVAYLLENGAQVGQQDGGHYTPLMYASEEGHIRVVLLLLTHMGEQAQRQALAATDASNRRTALHWAARGGHEEVVTALLGHGACADTRDKYGKSPLADAVHEGHLVVMLLLVDHLEMHALLQERDGNGKSLLHHAIEGRKEDSHHMVTYLLSQGLLPNLRDNHGSTALMYAAMGISRGNDMRSMQTLLEHMGGQGLDERNDAGRTALHFAVHHGRPANVRALLLAGADPTIMDNQGRSPRATDAMRCGADCAVAFNVSAHGTFLSSTPRATPRLRSPCYLTVRNF